jgi:AAHS family 3-hydroxyphenylpropionic acid transporter
MAMSDRRVGVTLALCFLAALTEGIDLQSMGVAAPMVAPEFGLDPKTLGNVLAASPVGLLVGAILGGRLADAWGRKITLVLSLAIFGAFTLATAMVDGTGPLLLVRFLTGVGLGGAMPNLLALTSEVMTGKSKISQVVLTFAGMPMGGVLVSYVAKYATETGDWRMIFYVGGIAPLLLAPVMMWLLPESQKFKEERELVRTGAKVRLNAFKVLLGEGRAPASLCIWTACLLLNLVSYLLLNWLPILNKSKGFNPADIATLQIVFNLVSFFGSVGMGYLMDLKPGKLVLGGCFVGLALGLVSLGATGSDVLLASLLLALTGTCLYGALYIVYGLIPGYYPVLVRGVGGGASFASGRIGAIIGPMLAGQILGGGRGPSDVLQALLPVVAVAGIGAMVLLMLPARAREEEAVAALAE